VSPEKPRPEDLGVDVRKERRMMIVIIAVLAVGFILFLIALFAGLVLDNLRNRTLPRGTPPSETSHLLQSGAKTARPGA